MREVPGGKEVHPVDAHDSPVIGVAFSADGRRVISRSRTGIRAWETPTGRLLHSATGETASESLIAFLPDGRLLTEDRQARLFRVRDPLTDREALRFEGRPDVGTPAIAPGGRYAALSGPAGEACILDLRTGACRERFEPEGGAFGPKLSSDGDVFVWYRRAADGIEVRVRRHTTRTTVLQATLPQSDDTDRWLRTLPYVSPDGRWLIAPAGNHAIRRWDLVAGKELAPLTEAQMTVWHLHWSSDGRYLATHGRESEANVIDPDALQDVRVWDLASGKRLTLAVPDSQSLLFTSDSRTLLTTDLEGTIHLWEVLTGKERGQLKGHLAGEVGSLALSPDGRMLASGGYDSQVLLWDLTGRTPDGHWRTARSDPAQLRTAWDTLAEIEAPAAYAALWQLAGDAEGTRALLQEKLRPVARADSDRVAKLVAALDADNFAERQRAARALEGLGDAAAADLRQALDKGPSPEVRKRLDGLLDRLHRVPSGEQLQALRGVEVLEHVGTPEARALLEALAKGAPEARLTREAGASLQRLSKRPN